MRADGPRGRLLLILVVLRPRLLDVPRHRISLPVRPFPASDASLLEIQKTNQQIQNVLLTTRPFGPTPIDGMMDDAKDYFWYNAIGPAYDPYVARAACRAARKT